MALEENPLQATLRMKNGVQVHLVSMARLLETSTCSVY